MIDIIPAISFIREVRGGDNNVKYQRSREINKHYKTKYSLL